MLGWLMQTVARFDEPRAYEFGTRIRAFFYRHRTKQMKYSRNDAQAQVCYRGRGEVGWRDAVMAKTRLMAVNCNLYYLCSAMIRALAELALYINTHQTRFSGNVGI